MCFLFLLLLFQYMGLWYEIKLAPPLPYVDMLLGLTSDYVEHMSYLGHDRVQSEFHGRYVN